MYSNDDGRNDYDIGASQEVQSRFETIAGLLEAALGRRDSDVKAAMAVYQADGVSDQYAAMEAKWNAAGEEVRNIITTLRNSLGTNDEIAATALKKAASHVNV
ncbi:MAG TPA: pore-forming ESAT-6 family protein [Actinotalea caeni]|uniref:pore-forming ESAT-6 family protein n=1 Tax=Actinotalea caeni TaxID=1348467 RepID=UPI0012E2C944|nr:pore-forming ESAT-6 family protein [Actinotalea caeni]HLV57124.1 pore-forming ESAT-6 family protein [Actinotalea caeni]